VPTLKKFANALVTLALRVSNISGACVCAIIFNTLCVKRKTAKMVDSGQRQHLPPSTALWHSPALTSINPLFRRCYDPAMPTVQLYFLQAERQTTRCVLSRQPDLPSILRHRQLSPARYAHEQHYACTVRRQTKGGSSHVPLLPWSCPLEPPSTSSRLCRASKSIRHVYRTQSQEQKVIFILYPLLGSTSAQLQSLVDSY
jgi:hypothetical protein